MKSIKLVDKYLAFEFIKLFLLMVFALIVILISAYLFELTDFIIIREIPAIIVGRLLLYRLPMVIIESLSIAVLFATILSLGRFVSDNEFTALRMGGIKFSRMVLPLLLLATLISGVNYFITERVLPWSNEEYQRVIDEDIYQRSRIEEDEELFFKSREDKYFSIGSVDDQEQRLENIVVYDKRENRLISAPKGFFKDDFIYLEEGLVNLLDKGGFSKKNYSFETLELDIKRSIRDYYGEDKRPNQMNRAQLRERIKLFREGGRDTNDLRVEYHFKLAQALVSIIFVLIGAPLSIKSNKGRIFGIIASVVIIFIYYLTSSITRSLGINLLLDPFWAAWIPNLGFAILGVLLIFKEDYLNLR
ncbi:LptF/LptG family permease [Halonatronum saccharophilum]|uniref:LptF/LptG family permease n=1 Tax=Halonatronum saccharophilum TaxID=150060 RepID=UPI000482B5C9|nr:LptF/LptG family permease [Halonatronum saccharophilum]